MDVPLETRWQRLARYARDFVGAVAVAIAVGGVLGAVTPLSLADGIATALLVVGVGLLLAGGLTGGGYVRTSGDYGIHYGKRHDEGLHSTEGDIARIRDLRARMRRELRPGADPAAFWQVIGGLVAAGLGVLVLQIAG